MPGDHPAPVVIAHRYRVLRTIGRGAMGVVHEVEHVHTGERLALKLLAGTAPGPIALERFRREARASALLKTNHVVRVLDAGIVDELANTPFLVMELLAGSDLGTLVRTGGAQSPADVGEWLRQASIAIDRAHGLGLIHRDLKPANLFLAASDQGPAIIKILDFGLAKLLQPEEGADQTDSGVALGTPAYMSPEQARGGADLGPASDIWSIGMTAYTLLAGERYWKDDAATAVLTRLSCETILPPSARGLRLGPRFDQWFLRSCARDSKQRFPCAGEQARALMNALAETPARAAEVSAESTLSLTTASTNVASASPGLAGSPPGSRLLSKAIVVVSIAATAGGTALFVATRKAPVEPAPAALAPAPQSAAAQASSPNPTATLADPSPIPSAPQPAASPARSAPLVPVPPAGSPPRKKAADPYEGMY